MTVDVLQQKKEEVAKGFLKEFKSELGFFQGMLFGFFEKKVTTAMTSSDVITENSINEIKPKLSRIEKLFAQSSPETAQKLLLFIKQKQEQLVKANTVEELDDLQKGIITPTTQSQEEKTSEEKTPSTEQAQQPVADEQIGAEGEQSQEPVDHTIENIGVGAGVAGGTVLGVVALDKIDKLKQAGKLQNIEIKNTKQFAEKMQQQFLELSKKLNKEKDNVKLLKFQKKALEKSAKQFEAIAKNMDDDMVKAAQWMGKLDQKLPASLLKTIDPKEASKIFALGENFYKEIDAIKKLNISDDAKLVKMEKLFADNSINVDKNVIKAFHAMEGIEEIKGAAFALTKAKGLRKFLNGMRGIIFLDLIATGLDVRFLLEGLDEATAVAKLNQLRASAKRERAWVICSTSVAITALGIIGTCAAAGSTIPGLGTAVGLAVGVTSFAVYQAVEIYYDKVEFYLTNEEEFKRQYRTELKHAIIQSAATKEWNLNSIQTLDAARKKAGASRAERRLVPFGLMRGEKAKITTNEDAWKTLIWQEEFEKPEYTMIQQGFDSGKTQIEFRQGLSPEEQKLFDEQQKALTDVINKRFEYIKRFMYKSKDSNEYKSFIAAIQNGLGIKMVEKISADSKVYHEMGLSGTDQYVSGCQTIAEYKTKFGEKLKAFDVKGFETLEKIFTQEPYKFLEIYHGVKNFEEAYGSYDPNDTEMHDATFDGQDATIRKNIELVKRFYEYKMLGVPMEEQKQMEISPRSIDLNIIANLLMSGNFAAFETLAWNTAQAKNYLMENFMKERVDANLEYSDSVGQNIIYRIAREIHGYQGHNNLEELMAFFREDKGAALGLYYSSGGRKINNDRAVDQSIDINAFETMTAEEILKTRVSSHWVNHVLNIVIDPSPIKASGGGIIGLLETPAMIDTLVEAGDMDQKLNDEYRKRLSTIIQQEKGFKNPEIKKQVEEQIIAYIQNTSKSVDKAFLPDGEPDPAAGKESGYMELPYYLVLRGSKSGIGKLENFIFKYENNQIVACTTQEHLGDKLDFGQTKTNIRREYIDPGKQIEQEKLAPYFAYVDEAKYRFLALLNPLDGKKTKDNQGSQIISSNILDIPREYFKIYQDKIRAWEEFKISLTALAPDAAKDALEERYAEFHDYFENQYLAILLKISKMSYSGKFLDSASDIQEINFLAQQITSITPETAGGFLSQLTSRQKKIFGGIIQQQKIDGKDVLTLLKSGDSLQKEKALRAAKQIIKSILEGIALGYTKDGKIMTKEYSKGLGVAAKSLYGFSSEADLEKRNSQAFGSESNLIQTISENANARIKVNLDRNKYFDPANNIIPEQERNIDQSNVVIMTEKKEIVTKQISAAEEAIIKTAQNSEDPRLGRGGIFYDPEKNLIKSRGKAIEIDPETLMVKGLSLKFKDAKELVLVANFLNRVKTTYPAVKEFERGSRGNLGIGQRAIYLSGHRILTLDAIKEKFPSLLDADNNVKKEFIDFLNK